MKKITLIICLLLNIFHSNAQCLNGDVEMNSFSNWQGYTGFNTTGTLNLSTFVPGLVSGRHTIVSSGGYDPIVGNTIPLVTEGNYAIKLGNNSTNSEAEILSYTFTVPDNFSFRYALVLQDPSSAHTAMQKPFFSYWISTSANLANSTLPGNLIVTKKFTADASNSFFKTMTYLTEPLVYKEWQTECVPDLNAYVGQTITIYFATADCTEGQHFGYAYIDGLCKSNPPVPLLNGPSSVCNIDDPITFDGSGTINETEHYWSISECDINGNPFGTIQASLPVSAPVTSINLSSVWGNLQGGHYYKITLLVKNCTSGWVSTSKIIFIQYPIITTKNVVVCCGADAVIGAQVIYDGSRDPSNFKWYDENGALIGNGEMTSAFDPVFDPNFPVNVIRVNPDHSTKYRLVYEFDGCKNEQWVFVTMVKNVSLGFFNCINYDNCSGKGTIGFNPAVTLCGDPAQISDYEFHRQAAINSYSFLWNTGETTSAINMTGNNQYNVTVTSPCGNYTASITPPIFSGSFPNLFIPNAMTVTNPFVIYNTLMSAGTIPAYNANIYELSVWDRWGARVYYKYISAPCLGFYNGEITWDGKYNDGPNNGNYVNFPDTYTYQLKLYNCNGNSQTYAGTVDFIQ